jgi:hypothetical protein
LYWRLSDIHINSYTWMWRLVGCWANVKKIVEIRSRMEMKSFSILNDTMMLICSIHTCCRHQILSSNIVFVILLGKRMIFILTEFWLLGFDGNINEYLYLETFMWLFPIVHFLLKQMIYMACLRRSSWSLDDAQSFDTLSDSGLILKNH